MMIIKSEIFYKAKAKQLGNRFELFSLSLLVDIIFFQ
jgi:hypothetical protein